MSFGLHKPGQGYWMRVITASMLGVIVIATAAWAWDQAELLADRLPRTAYALNLASVSGDAPAPGAQVELLAAAEPGRDPEVIASARVAAFDQGQRTLRVAEIADTSEEYHPGQARSVRAGGGAFQAAIAGTPQPLAAIEPLYLQGAAAALVLLLGALLIYWLVGVSPRASEFLIATDTEVKKVNWSTRRDIRASTFVVIGAAALMALMLWGVDWVFATTFRAIGILTAGRQ